MTNELINLKGTIMKKMFQVLALFIGLSIIAIQSKAQTQTKTVHKEKTGWSNKAKGAAIGAGAGAGYLIGRHKDKKNPGKKKVYKTKTTVSSK